MLFLFFFRSTGYFDIHPPLGKLILAYGGKLFGYRPDPSFIIKSIGDLYPPTVNFLALRKVSALFSVATVPMMYLVARALVLSRVASFFAAFQTLFCFLGIIEGRIIVMDSQLLFFSEVTLLSGLALWRSRVGTSRRWVLLASTGVAAGLALSIKHTALGTPGLIAIVCFFGVHFLPEPLTIMECAYAGAIAIFTYSLPFYPYLTRPWSTGDKYDKFMRGLPSFQRTIKGFETYDPDAKRPSFVRMLVYMNLRMLASNANVKKRHRWESDWYQWIVSWRGVLYYTLREPKNPDGTKGRKTIVYLVGNPVGIILVLASVGIFIGLTVTAVRLRRYQKPSSRNGFSMYNIYTGIFLLSGWLCNLMPYILVDRAAFLYHYMPGLFYGHLLASLLVDFLPTKSRVVFVAIVCAALTAAFLYWAPWIYALPLTDKDHSALKLLPKWD